MTTVPGRPSFTRPLDVLGVVRLVGVDEDEVERRLAGELRQDAERPPYPQVDHLAEPGPRDVRCAVLAWCGSYSMVTSLPPAGSARAIQIVE